MHARIRQLHKPILIIIAINYIIAYYSLPAFGANRASDSRPPNIRVLKTIISYCVIKKRDIIAISELQSLINYG